jgi:predicted RNA-binding Zn ribbon-like protein
VQWLALGLNLIGTSAGASAIVFEEPPTAAQRRRYLRFARAAARVPSRECQNYLCRLRVYDLPVLVRDSDAAMLVAIRLVNSYDTYEEDPERLPTTDVLRSVLRKSGFPAAASPTARDLSEARALRDVLRQVFEPRAPAVKARVLNELLERAPARATIAVGRGEWEIAFDVDQRATLSRRLAAVSALGLADALRRYGDERLKVCDAAPCQNVFIDLSKNMVRRHCSRRCANRVSAAAFRARARGREAGGQHAPARP